MRKPAKVGETPATRLLRSQGVAFSEHVYDYIERGGTSESARQLGLPEHAIVKTLVMQDDRARPSIVLMHGDRQVGLKLLARELGCRSVEPCRPEVAERHTGYRVGGTSPFALRRALPIHVEATVLGLPRLWINGGRRGYLVGIDPEVLTRLLEAHPVRCAQESAGS